MKLFSSPFTLDGPPLKSAKLVYPRYMGEAMSYDLTVVNNPNGTSTLTTSATLPKGVMRLLVTPTDTKCCCRSMMVYTEGCPPSLFKGLHTSSSSGDPVPSCDPATV